MRILSFILVLLVISIPFVQAETIKKEGNMYEITEWVTLSRGKGNITLNLSDPQEIAKYSPVNNFWDTNLTGPGKIVDGVLPPDFAFLNTSSLNLTWNFTLSSNEIADGASEFILRLPVSFDISHGVITPVINLTIKKASQSVLWFSNSDGRNTSDLKDMKIDYANLTLHMWYLHLIGILYPGTQYTLQLNLSHITNTTLLVYAYDYFNDNSTEFYINNQNYSGDLATGFEFQTLTSNGISALHVNSIGPSGWPQADYEQDITLNKSYSGLNYVSFAFEIYVPSDHYPSQILNVTFSTSTDTNTTLIDLSEGLHTIRGNMQLNFSGEKKVHLSITSEYDFYLIVNGYYENMANGTFLSDEMPYLHTYLKPYGDVVVNPEEYYVPGAIVLPGSWQESVDLALKYAPPSLLLVILNESEFHTAIYTFVKVVQFASYLMYQAMNFIGGEIKDLLHKIPPAFDWIDPTRVHFLISDAAWVLWAFLKAAWFALQIGIYLLAVWITDSFLRGIAVLPEKGFKGMIQEWSGVTSFIEDVAGRVMRIAGRFRG